MTRYLIVGAGGFGREVYHAATLFLQCSVSDSNVQVAGFLDDNSAALDKYFGYPPVVDSICGYKPQKYDRLYFAIGIPAVKYKVAGLLKNKNIKFETLIHPDSDIAPNTNIGFGSNIGWHCCVSCDVRIGNFVSLNCDVTVGHDAVIEDFVEVGPGSRISGFCHIEEGVHIASNCVIAPGVRISKWSKIHAGSAVMRNVPAGAFVVGVPGVIHSDFFTVPDTPLAVPS